MISAKVLARQVEKFAVDNAPGILTGIGVVGAVSTALLTGKATFKAARLIEIEQERRFRMNEAPSIAEPLSTKDTVKVVWVAYLPPAGVLGVTVTAIVCANRVSTGRLAALATAYSLSEKRMVEYREKVVEKFNPTKERQIQDEIAQDRVTANPPQEKDLIITGNGQVLCYDLPSGRYFHSNVERIRSVQNDTNQQVNEIGYADLEAFYLSLGLKPTPYSDELGWITSKLLDIHFSATLTEENQPCVSINYTCEPIRHQNAKGCESEPPF